MVGLYRLQMCRSSFTLVWLSSYWFGLFLCLKKYEGGTRAGKTKQTSFISYHLHYIEKHDHTTWMKVSKLKKNVFKYSGLAANAKNMLILFECLGITITYVYSTISQVHILLIVAWCAAQNLFGILLNTEGYRTH